VEGEGVRILMEELLKQLEEGATPQIRVEAAGLMATYCADPDSDFTNEIPTLITGLMKQFNSTDASVQTAVIAALTALTSSIRKELIPNYLSIIGDSLRNLQETAPSGGLVPGFCVPKGVAPLLPIFTQALLTGTPQAREEAAEGLLTLIKLTSDVALKPHLIQLVGPLVRITSDKFPWEVKAAILHILHLSIKKGGIVLKIIIGPLQTTFVKALQDPQAPAVRNRAALALGAVSALNPKIDPLVLELSTLASGQQQSGIIESVLSGLKEVLLQAGKSVTPDAFSKVGKSLGALLQTEDENVRSHVARAIGAFAKFAPAEQVDAIVRERLLEGDSSWQSKHGACLALTSIVQYSPASFASHRDQIVNFLLKNLKDEKAAVRQAAVECVGQIVLVPEVAADSKLLTTLLTPITESLADQSNDVKIVSINIIKEFAKIHVKETQSLLTLLVPPLLNRVKEKSNMPAKLASERALMHALQIYGNQDVLKQYSETMPGEAGKALLDYGKRILSKLEKNSDSEDEEED